VPLPVLGAQLRQGHVPDLRDDVEAQILLIAASPTGIF
jgi:hypothetical protein